MKFFRFLIIFFFVWLLPVHSFCQSYHQNTSWIILNICYSIEWENECSVNEYNLSVFCLDNEFDTIYNFFETERIIEKKWGPFKINKKYSAYGIKGKKVNVQRCDNLSLLSDDIHIIYISEEYGYLSQEIFEMVKGENILILSNNSGCDEFSCINFTLREDIKGYKKSSININEKNMKLQNLKLHTELSNPP